MRWLQSDLDSKGISTILIEVDGGEASKSRDYAFQLVDEVFKRSDLPIGGFVVIGGGATLNVCSFVCSLVARGVYPTILVPTTVMALADVAIGSKTAVNLGPTAGHHNDTRSGKNSIGTYHNPAAVLVCKDIVDFDNAISVLWGLAEVLKHGIALDEQKATRAFQCIDDVLDSKVNDHEIYDLALWTMRTKADILTTDPYELSQGRILQIGHLHAHSLETASSYAVPHGLAVYWGLLLDCLIAKRLGHSEQVSIQKLIERIANILRHDKLISILSPWLDSNLVKSYSADTKRYHRSISGFNILRIEPYSGHFEDISIPIDRLQEVIKEAKTLVSASN